MFSRSTRIGIAALSALAEGSRTAADISRRRRITSAYLAKILTALSRHGLIRGTRGPGGGYRLARPPERISLLDIVSCFESVERAPLCPLGRTSPCSSRQPCALHGPFQKMWHAQTAFMADTTLAGFAIAAPAKLRVPR
jgi:Rrf2 family iron-sulfur cluster assembly transcriptional regulator